MTIGNLSSFKPSDTQSEINRQIWLTGHRLKNRERIAQEETDRQ